VLKRSGVTLFALWTFFACGGRDNAEVYSADGGLLSCGNGQLDPEEECDGEVMGDIKTCEDAMIPRATGTLRCKNCTLDTSSCRTPTGTGGRGSGGMMSLGGGGSMGRGLGGRQNVGGTMGLGGRSQGGTMGFAGRSQGGNGGTMGLGGRGGRSGGGAGAGGSAPIDAGMDSGPIADAGPTCAGSSDCGSGQVCCGTIANGQYTGFTCQANCGTNNTVVDCSRPSDCTGGQVCCGMLQTGQNVHYTSISCQATCGQAPNEFTQCTSDAQCTGGLTCQTSQYLPPPFRVCR
jgi:hypothetical protein